MTGRGRSVRAREGACVGAGLQAERGPCGRVRAERRVGRQSCWPTRLSGLGPEVPLVVS